MRPRNEATPSMETTGELHDVMANHLQATGLTIARHPWEQQQKALALTNSEADAALENAGRIAPATRNWVLRLEMEVGFGKVHVFAKKGNEELKVLTAELKPVRKSKNETEKNEFPIETKTYAIPTEFMPIIDSLVQVLKKRKTIIGSETTLSKPVLPKERIKEIAGRKNGQIAFALKRIGDYYESVVPKEMGRRIPYPGIQLDSKSEGNKVQFIARHFIAKSESYDDGSLILTFKHGKLGFPHTILVKKPEGLHLAGVIQDTFKYALPRHRIRVVRDYED